MYEYNPYSRVEQKRSPLKTKEGRIILCSYCPTDPKPANGHHCHGVSFDGVYYTFYCDGCGPGASGGPYR